MGSKGFNLLKQQAAPPTAWEKIYAWALGTARVIVIIVQLIVVGSFVARVIVDTQAKEITNDLETRESTLSGFTESEKRFRAIQSRATMYEFVWKNSSSYSKALEELNSKIIGNYAGISISVDDGFVTIRGEGDIDQISKLEESIKSSESFTGTETFTLEASNTSGARRVVFGMRTTIKDYNVREFQK